MLLRFCYGTTVRNAAETFNELIRLFDDCDEFERRLLLTTAIGAVKALKQGLREYSYRNAREKSLGSAL
jgi:hypothetical protein